MIKKITKEIKYVPQRNGFYSDVLRGQTRSRRLFHNQVFRRHKVVLPYVNEDVFWDFQVVNMLCRNLRTKEIKKNIYFKNYL